MDDSTVEAFIEDTKNRCCEYGIKIVFRKSKSVEVEKGIRCTGYFNSEELVVSRLHPLWLGVLVHESCHLDQFVEQSPIWKKEELNGTSTLDKWLQGKSVYSLTKSINNLIALELDCERRAIKKIVEYDLPINTITYIQRANELLMYYRFVQKTGRWSNRDLGSYAKFPSKFMSASWYKKLSPKAEKIFNSMNL